MTDADKIVQAINDLRITLALMPSLFAVFGAALLLLFRKKP